MAEKLQMLALSPTMEEGVIVKWLKQEGDAISSGETICEVETDKAIMEYQALSEGVLLKIALAEGESAKIGDMIGIIGETGEDISELMADTPVASKPETEIVTAPAEEPKDIEVSREFATGTEAGGKIRSSPLARTLAEKHGINLRTVAGSGPGGRIVERDIQQFLTGPAAVPAQLAAETISVTEKRKLIAQRLSESMFSAPHYYLKITALVDGLLAERKKYKARTGQKISLNGYLMKITAETLKKHPMVNATWQGDTIVKHGQVDIALAVAQADGLITPVVRDCGSKGLAAIEGELKALIEKARQGLLTPPEYTNSTFTITNLGGFGIEEFTAIINSPNSAILAVGAALKQPMVDDDGGIVARTMMRLTLSCDHRLVDGVIGAAFLSDLKTMMEYPIDQWY